ncbi:MAG: NUDIX domain-containing protein [Thermoplasmata archaeon]
MAEGLLADEGPVDQECVEGYLYVAAPLSVLVLRRPPGRGGFWVPVSGKVDRTDPDLPSALRRELAEETGFVPPRPLQPLDWSVRFEGPDGGRWRLHAYAVELDARYVPTLSPEHDAFRWVSFSEAQASLHYPDNREAALRLLGRLVGSLPRPPPKGL